MMEEDRYQDNFEDMNQVESEGMEIDDGGKDGGDDNDRDNGDDNDGGEYWHYEFVCMAWGAIMHALWGVSICMQIHV